MRTSSNKAPARTATRTRNLLLILAMSLPLLAAMASLARAADPFFAGKTITIHVGFSAGGGYDLYARTFAPFLAKHLPGNPQHVVKNAPGAGSAKLAAWLADVAPKTGTDIATLSRGIPVEAMLGGLKTSFDPLKANWIGSMNNEVSICAVMAKTGIKSIADMATREVSFGAQGKASDSHLFALFVSNVLGIKAKVITGYPGTNESVLAMERGEVDGNCGWSWSSVKQKHEKWITGGTLLPLIQLALVRHPDLPKVPLMMELVKTPEEKAQVELVLSRQTMGRPFVAPAGVPADRVAMLRKAFTDAMADPEFIAQAKKSKLEINPVSGQDVQALVERVLKTPAAVVAQTRKNLGQ